MRMKALLWTAFALLGTGFDIPVFGVDILPDILGYVILFICFSILTARENTFLRPRLLSALLLLLELVFILHLVEDKNILLLLRVTGVLIDLLMFFFAFAALNRLALSFEQSDLRRPIDSAFFFYAPTAALPLIADLAPEIEKLCLFIGVCLYLYVFNVVIRCYRQIIQPIEIPASEERSSLDDSDDIELNILPDAPPSGQAADEQDSSDLQLPDYDE